MDNQKKFNETLLPEEDDFHSDLNMEDIAKRICKYFETKNLEEYHEDNNKYVKNYDKNK